MPNNFVQNKNTRNLILAAGMLCCFLPFYSCTNEPYRLEPKDQIVVDSVSNQEITRLAKNLEDSCNVHFNERVKKLCDSIVEYQIKLIGRQLDRNVQ